MKKTVILLTVFLILPFIRVGMAEDKKLPSGYTPPFEYEARPLLEKHTTQIDALAKDLTTLKNELKKTKESGAPSQKQGIDTNANAGLEKITRDINLLKNEVINLKNELGMVKQSMATANVSNVSVPTLPPQDIAGDIKTRVDVHSNNINSLQEKLARIEQRIEQLEHMAAK